MKCEVLSKGFDLTQCITSTASEAHHIYIGLLPSTSWTCPCKNIYSGWAVFRIVYGSTRKLWVVRYTPLAFSKLFIRACAATNEKSHWILPDFFFLNEEKHVCVCVFRCLLNYIYSWVAAQEYFILQMKRASENVKVCFYWEGILAMVGTGIFLGVQELGCWARGNPTASCRGLRRNHRAEGAKHFSVKPDDLTKSMCWDLQFRKLGLNARERNFGFKGSAALDCVTKGGECDVWGGFLTMAACSADERSSCPPSWPAWFFRYTSENGQKWLEKIKAWAPSATSCLFCLTLWEEAGSCWCYSMTSF